MKKMIALCVAASMVTALVPATAFAGQDIYATAKIVGSQTVAESSSTVYLTDDVPELQITVQDVWYSGTDSSFSNASLHESSYGQYTSAASQVMSSSMLQAQLLQLQADLETATDADEIAELEAQIASVERQISMAQSSTSTKTKVEKTEDTTDSTTAVEKKVYAPSTSTTETVEKVEKVEKEEPAETETTTETTTETSKPVYTPPATKTTAPVEEVEKTEEPAAQPATLATTEVDEEDEEPVAIITEDDEDEDDAVVVDEDDDDAVVATTDDEDDDDAVVATTDDEDDDDAVITTDDDDDDDAVITTVTNYTEEIEAAMKSAPQMEVELELDDAEFIKGSVNVYIDSDETYPAIIDDIEIDEDEMTFVIYGKLYEDDKIIVELAISYELDDGDYATISIDSDMVEADDMVIISAKDRGFDVSVDDIVYVAEDESVTLEDIEIEEIISGSFNSGDLLRLELSKGFEFDDVDEDSTKGVDFIEFDDEYAYFEMNSDAETNGEIKIVGLEIFADDADEGDVAEIEFIWYDNDTNDRNTEDKQYSSDKVDTVEIEVAECCAYTVVISVDEDDDVPVFYNGTDTDNYGLNDGGDHVSLEITIEESFPGAWNYRDTWELTLPEGVYVIDVEFDNDTDIDWSNGEDNEANFIEAYQDGDWEGFEFGKRVFEERDSSDDPITIVFTLTLVAAPDFEGEVELGFVGDSVDEDEVVIAEFISPFTVEASQNDVITDYRNTPIETPIIIEEAEEELWSDEMVFYLSMEGEYMSFDYEGDVSVNSDSDMEVDVDVDSSDAKIEISIDEESDDEAGVITIENIELYMNRTLAAGAYALEMYTSASVAFMAEPIYGPEAEDEDDAEDNDEVWFVGDVINGTDDDDFSDGKDGYVIEVCENFVNIVTAGSDTGNTFTTKIIVPIGEYYMYAGGTMIELDVPAYISADGYTMLPVRAVATAIGVDTSCVLWDSASKQVTIIYGSKTIAMVIGQSYMTVNGTNIPTSASPEITDSRTFLPLRDLATALGVTDISWDSSTRTAYLN